MNRYLKFNEFIIEALKDEIPSYMNDILSKRYDSKYMEMDVPKHTDKIPNVKIEITDKNITDKTIAEIVEYFKSNIFIQFKNSTIYDILKKNIEMNDILKKQNIDLYKDVKNISFLYSNDIQLIDVKTKQLSRNKSNLYKFVQSYNKAFNTDIEWNPNTDKVYSGLRQVITNYDENINKIENTKLYLYISDKAEDKLRMSISKFYDSCQNIYTGGVHGTSPNKKLLANVFDENSKVAYLMFDTEYKDIKGNVHPFTSIARTIIRYNENTNKIMFDQVYPNDMEGVIYKIIEESTGLKNEGSYRDVYIYKGIGLPSPYMDKYIIKNVGVINKTNKLQALYQHLKEENQNVDNEITINITDIEEKGESDFSYDDTSYVVYTAEEANEKARDYIRNNWTEYIGEKTIFDVIDNYDWFDAEKLKKYLENKYDITIIDLSDYIKKNYADLYFNHFMKDVGIDYLKTDDYVKFDDEDFYDNFCDSLYGSDLSDSRGNILSGYDGEENYEIVDGEEFFIYREG